MSEPDNVHVNLASPSELIIDSTIPDNGSCSSSSSGGSTGGASPMGEARRSLQILENLRAKISSFSGGGGGMTVSENEDIFALRAKVASQEREILRWKLESQEKDASHQRDLMELHEQCKMDFSEHQEEKRALKEAYDKQLLAIKDLEEELQAVKEIRDELQKKADVNADVLKKAEQKRIKENRILQRQAQEDRSKIRTRLAEIYNKLNEPEKACQVVEEMVDPFLIVEQTIQDLLEQRRQLIESRIDMDAKYNCLKVKLEHLSSFENVRKDSETNTAWVLVNLQQRLQTFLDEKGDMMSKFSMLETQLQQKDDAVGHMKKQREIFETKLAECHSVLAKYGD